MSGGLHGGRWSIDRGNQVFQQILGNFGGVVRAELSSILASRAATGGVKSGGGGDGGEDLG